MFKVIVHKDYIILNETLYTYILILKLTKFIKSNLKLQ